MQIMRICKFYSHISILRIYLQIFTTMILATHALTGAAIGKIIPNPLIIISVSLVVHFIMDGFRHGEYFDSRVATIKDTYWKVILDLGIGALLISSYIFFTRPEIAILKNILIGSFFSILPDFFTLIYFKFKSKALIKLIDFHSLAHRYDRFPKYSPERQWTLRNALNDILITILSLAVLFI